MNSEESLFVIPGIKIENDDIKPENEIKEEMNLEEAKIWSEEKVNCGGNLLSSFSDEKVQKSKAIKTEGKRGYINSIIYQNNVEKSTSEEGGEIQAPCGKVNIPDHKRFKSKQCDVCDGYFQEKHQLEKHEASIHGNVKVIKPFMCTECGNSFAVKEHLISHVKSKHIKIMKPYMCTECDNSFSLQKYLTNHVRSVHRNEKTLTCTECDNSFHFIKHLTNHVRSVHKNEKTFRCAECGKSFTLNQYLTRHIISVHRKEKTFKCTDCDFSCSSKGRLASHRNSVHHCLELFNCAECEYTCSSKRRLAVHIRLVHRKLKNIIAKNVTNDSSDNPKVTL